MLCECLATFSTHSLREIPIRWELLRFCRVSRREVLYEVQVRGHRQRTGNVSERDFFFFFMLITHSSVFTLCVFFSSILYYSLFMPAFCLHACFFFSCPLGFSEKAERAQLSYPKVKKHFCTVCSISLALATTHCSGCFLWCGSVGSFVLGLLLWWPPRGISLKVITKLDSDERPP